MESFFYITLVAIPIVTLVVFVYVITNAIRLRKHTCPYCSAIVSPRAAACATCGDPLDSRQG